MSSGIKSFKVLTEAKQAIPATTMSNKQVAEDEMLFISQLYPGFYSQMAPLSGETKSRGRRKNRKEEAKRGGLKKRKLSSEQVKQLEMNFGSQHRLESEKKNLLASQLGLDPRQVAVWFQNRRARWKAKKLEDEYSKLKTLYESILVEKCRLETEAQDLKERLSQAEREIKWLSQRLEETSSSSGSSLPMDFDQHYLGEFGVIDLGDIF